MKRIKLILGSIIIAILGALIYVLSAGTNNKFKKSKFETKDDLIETKEHEIEKKIVTEETKIEINKDKIEDIKDRIEDVKNTPITITPPTNAKDAKNILLNPPTKSKFNSIKGIVLIFVLSLLYINTPAQIPDTCFTEPQLIEMATYRLQLEAERDRAEELVELYETELFLIESNDSLYQSIITLKDDQIDLLNTRNNLYLKELRKQDSFFHKPKTNFIFGILIGISGTILILNVGAN